MLNNVYGHGQGTLKPEYYDGECRRCPLFVRREADVLATLAFVPPKPAVRGLFNTRDRLEHSRKRKIVSHTFAPKTIIAFEPFIRREVQVLLERWDEFCAAAKKENTPGPRGLMGRAWLDCLEWMNYFAFDTIGDLAFGTSKCLVSSLCLLPPCHLQTKPEL